MRLHVAATCRQQKQQQQRHHHVGLGALDGFAIAANGSTALAVTLSPSLSPSLASGAGSGSGYALDCISIRAGAKSQAKRND